MDDHKTLLVREVITRLNESAEIEGNIVTPFPIKEIYEVKYNLLSPVSHFGKKAVTYSGEINFKVIYIDNNDNCLRQIEQVLPYRGFSFFQIKEPLTDPDIKVRTSVQDLFAEKEANKTIKINGFLSLEILISRERELLLGELHGFQLISENNSTQSSQVVETEVLEGSDQEITITLD